MLFTRRELEGIASGEITLAFRRWERPRSRAGGRQRTALGVISIDSVDEVELAGIDDAEARRAGRSSRAELVEWLERRGPGPVWRIGLSWAGEDPRVALRARTDLGEEELAELRRRLGRLDGASRHGAWTEEVLRLIAARPEVRAADLAAGLGRETQPFKRDVRKLKELGLTESLEVGYRLSARGRALLERGLSP